MPGWIAAAASGNALLGLAAAALWGGGDFAGSMAVKQGGGNLRSALRVVVIGHLVSMLVLVAFALLLHDPFALAPKLLWAVGGGLISGVALMGFYLALATGHMGAAAAVSGLLCAAVPAIFSIWQEGTPGWRKLAGFGLAAAAIWLVASAGESAVDADTVPAEQPAPKRTPLSRSMLLSILSGLGFGVYFVALKLSSGPGILWPTVAARVGSWSICAVLLCFFALRTPARSAAIRIRGILPWIVGGSMLDLGGNLSFVAAARAGRLDVAAVLASLYPAATILLAAVFLKERTNGRQKIGMLLALPAVVLIAA